MFKAIWPIVDRALRDAMSALAVPIEVHVRADRAVDGELSIFKLALSVS